MPPTFPLQTPAPRAPAGNAVDLSLSDLSIPQSLNIPTSLGIDLSTNFNLPTNIGGISIPSSLPGITIHVSADTPSNSATSTTSSTSSTTSAAATTSSAPSASSTSPSSHHNSNAAVLAGIFTAVALLLLLCLGLCIWFVLRRRRRRRRDEELAAAGVIPRGTVSRARFWHVRGGDGSTINTRSVRSSSSEDLRAHEPGSPSDEPESDMVFTGPGMAGLGASHQHPLLVPGASRDMPHAALLVPGAAHGGYPTDALLSPASPLSFDRVTHPDGSYFPVVWGETAVAAGGVYPRAPRSVSPSTPGPHVAKRDPFADDPRASRASDDGTSFSAGSASGTGSSYGGGGAWATRAAHDPSFVFGESFLGAQASPHQLALSRAQAGAAPYPPLMPPAPVLAHASQSMRGSIGSRFGSGTSASGSGSGNGSSAHGPSSSSQLSQYGTPLQSPLPPGAAPAGVPFPRGPGGPREPHVRRASSHTGYGDWLSGGLGGGSGAHGSGPDDADDELGGGWSSSQAAAHSATHPPLAAPSSESGLRERALDPIPERNSFAATSPSDVDHGTPAALEDGADYTAPRRLSIANL